MDIHTSLEAHLDDRVTTESCLPFSNFSLALLVNTYVRAFCFHASKTVKDFKGEEEARRAGHQGWSPAGYGGQEGIPSRRGKGRRLETDSLALALGRRRWRWGALGKSAAGLGEEGMGTNSSWKPRQKQARHGAKHFMCALGPGVCLTHISLAWARLDPQAWGMRNLLEKPREPGRACWAKGQSLGVKREED